MLVLAVVLPGCTELARSDNEPPMVLPPAAELAAQYFRSTFTDRSQLDSFEMSSPRWVHSITGWNWLVCVRYRDHDHQRIYALFIQNNAVVDGRYAVETDACAAQAYTPLDIDAGVLGRPTPPRQPALY